MHHGYDTSGWYVGQVEPDSDMSTPIAPPIDSTTTVPGEPRARWWRFAWSIEAFPAPVVPDSVEMWQARAELIDRDLLDPVLAAIDAIEDPKQRRLAHNKFEFAGRVNRADPLFQQLSQALGLSDPQLDELLISAAARQ
jgi:hypothetical protein